MNWPERVRKSPGASQWQPPPNNAVKCALKRPAFAAADIHCFRWSICLNVAFVSHGGSRHAYGSLELLHVFAISRRVFEQPGQGGRRKGARHRISTALLEAIAKDFAEHGEEVVKITRIEKPVEYLRIVAGLLPRELEITVGPLQKISDDELEKLIADARHKLIDITPSNAGGGAGPAKDAEPARLLSPLSQTTRIS